MLLILTVPTVAGLEFHFLVSALSVTTCPLAFHLLKLLHSLFSPSGFMAFL